MNQEDKRAIVTRIEQVRQALHLNKSQFSSRIGLKPQTYNNIIGAQGSKPNVELLVGLVKIFDVNPLWLLIGRGEMFTPSYQCGIDRTGAGRTTTASEEAIEIHRHITRMFADLSASVSRIEDAIADFRRAITKEPDRIHGDPDVHVRLDVPATAGDRG